jgi:hypothetical protein
MLNDCPPFIMPTWYKFKVSYHEIPPKLHISFNNLKNTRYKILLQTKQNLESVNLTLIPRKGKITSLASNQDTHNSKVLTTFEKYYYKHMSLNELPNQWLIQMVKLKLLSLTEQCN